jgi:hypothetical protein
MWSGVTAPTVAPCLKAITPLIIVQLVTCQYISSVSLALNWKGSFLAFTIFERMARQTAHFRSKSVGFGYETHRDDVSSALVQTVNMNQ